jgi:hypothetical protein
MKKIIMAAFAAFFASGSTAALADSATFTTATTTGCPLCIVVDPTGLTVTALGHQLPNGWDVRAGNGGLYLANGVGASFTLPAVNYPGKSFDLGGLKLFAFGRTGTPTPVTLTLYAYHFGNPIADTVQVTFNSQVVQTLTLTDPRLKNVDTLVMRYDTLQIRYFYVIQADFTPH